jgi:hypothetical protein
VHEAESSIVRVLYRGIGWDRCCSVLSGAYDNSLARGRDEDSVVMRVWGAEVADMNAARGQFGLASHGVGGAAVLAKREEVRRVGRLIHERHRRAVALKFRDPIVLLNGV